MAESEINTTPKSRGRPPKRPTPESTPEANCDYEFCSLNSSIAYSNYYFGMNIFDLYSSEQLVELVRNPMENNELLRELSLILYSCNGTYTNVIDYMVAMPTLDNVIVAHGKNNAKKKANKELMLSTLRTIRDKEFVRDALFCGGLDGIAFYYFETTATPASKKKMLTDFDVESICEINELGINASIISLPAKYTKIVGTKNSSYVIAFNLDYFYEFGNEPIESRLRKFPKEIRDAYAKNNKNQTLGNWVVLDNDHTITHKIRSKRSEPWGRPLVLAAINDILYGDYFTDTKRNVLDEINNRIVYQTFPEGEKKGRSALTQQQQQDQHDKVKGAVLNKNSRGGTSFVSVASGTKLNVLDLSNTDIFDEKYESDMNDRIALDFGFAGNALSGTGSGSYSAQESNLNLVTSQIIQWIEQIENELNKCINATIIKDKRNWVECKYLPITHLNQKSMVGYAKDLYLQGCGSLSLWSAACGISPETFYALLDEEIESGIYEKYKPHDTSYNTSGNNNNNPGRPETDDPSDSTVASRNNNGNALPSPSDNK